MKLLGGKIDLKSYFREYVSEIAKAHYIFRSHSAPLVGAANVMINELLRQFMSSGGDANHVALCAIAKEGSQYIESIPLASGIDMYCDYLMKNNTFFDQLDASYISSTGRDA
jgi:hypothetical protein